VWAEKEGNDSMHRGTTGGWGWGVGVEDKRMTFGIGTLVGLTLNGINEEKCTALRHTAAVDIIIDITQGPS